MLSKKLFRLAAMGVLLVLFSPFASVAQVTEGNYIVINLVEQTYDCATGEAYVKFHITNYDQWGNTGFHHTVYSIDLGASRVLSRSLPGGNGDVFFTGAYHPGDAIVCTAQGVSDNDAPQVEYRFVGNTPAAPAVPTISASVSMPLCNGASVLLTAAGSSGSFVWNNGQTGNTISVSAAGSYTVHAVGECGVSAESSPFVVSTASTPPAPVIGSSNGTLLCNGQSTGFTASSSGGTILWSNGATGTSMNTSAAGTYYASETNGCGTSGNSNVITISASNTPQAPWLSSSNGTSLCNGETTTLSAAPTAGGTLTWSTGATGNSIAVSSPGTYYAYETNSCGTSANSNTVSISTGSAASAPVITSSNGTFLCNGASTVLSASGSGIITWNTGSVSASIGVSSAGTYYAVASNNCGTSGESNLVEITTAQTPGAPTISSSNGVLLCNGATTMLSASPAYGGSIRWSNGAGGNSISVSNTGTYYAYESNGCGNGSGSNTISILAASSPAAPTITPSGTQQLCNGASVTLSSSGNDVLWSDGETGNTITVSTAGDYYAIDRNVCGNSSASNSVQVTTVVCPTPLPGSSFLVCPGTLKTLDAGAGYDTYSWSNGATTRTIAVGPGTYTVTVSRTGCFASSAPVTVGYYTVIAPTITASGATTFCAGGSVNLASSIGSAYAWSTGETTPSIHAAGNGAYYVTVTDGHGCEATSPAVNITVHALPTASISGGGTVCVNGSAPSVLFAGSDGTAPYTFSYRINGGSVQTVTTTSGESVSVPVPVSSAGSFTYTLLGVQESSSTACANAASGAVTVDVHALPSASINGSASVCLNSASPSISFSASGGSAPYTFSYTINGGSTLVVSTGSGNNVSVPVPTGVTGTFVYSLVSVQESGSCIASASGTATVTINPLPSATISGGATVCEGADAPLVRFSASGGIAPYTFSYRINGGSVQTVTTTSGNSVDVAAATLAAGDYTYDLLGVQESSGTACSNAASGSVIIHVHGLPGATISGDATVCRNAFSPSIVLVGSNGTAPYTFSYRINSGAVQTITSTSGNSATISVPTTAAGTYSYTLAGVQEASATACAANASGTATVVVSPLPTASIAGSAAVCQNASSPIVSFSGANGTAPYTFIYHINGGSDQTITSSGNTATINAPTAAAGTFTYSLVSVSDGSATACQNAVTGSATIQVNPQPAKAVITTANTHLCNGETGILTISHYVSGNTYNWYKDGVLIRSTTQDTLQVTIAGSYTVLPVSTEGCAAGSASDALIITTGSVTAPVITGSRKVCEGGSSLLVAKTADGQGYERWRWSSPPGSRLLSTDSGFFAAAGQYRVWVSTQGCADSVNVLVTNTDTEYPAGRLTATPDSIGYGETVTLSADVTGATSYVWDLGDARKIHTIGNVLRQSFYQAGDSLQVRVWAVSERNCMTQLITSVKVLPMAPTLVADHSFAGRLKDWNVFPIPFTDELKITAVLQRNETVAVSLFTADGRWLKNWAFKGLKGDNQFTIKGLEHLLEGQMYFITGYYNGQQHSEKIIKQQP